MFVDKTAYKIGISNSQQKVIQYEKIAKLVAK